MGFLTNKKTGEKFVPKAKSGKTVEQSGKNSLSKSFGKRKDEPLSLKEFKQILKERDIQDDDLASLKDQEEGNAKLISLHPENPILDNIIVKADSPHVYDEHKLNADPELRREQKERIKDER